MAQTGKTTPKKPWALSILPILVLALVLAACASTGREEKKTLQALKESAEAFNSAFRWEDYTAAAAFVPANKKEQFWIEVDRFKGKIRIVEYEIREAMHEEKGVWATIIVHFQYWRPASPTLQTVTFSQKWCWTEKDKSWKVSESGFGAITKEKAGF